MHKRGDQFSVDNEFLAWAEQLKQEWKNQFTQFENIENDDINVASDLNHDISLDVVIKSINISKASKSPGFDSVPIDVLKTGNITQHIWKLFNVCFSSGMIPRQWNQIVIRPIPKKGKDCKVPLNTRGINLIVAIAKLYTLVLNCRC